MRTVNTLFRIKVMMMYIGTKRLIWRGRVIWQAYPKPVMYLSDRSLSLETTIMPTCPDQKWDSESW